MSRRIQSTELQPRPAPQCCPGSLGRNPQATLVELAELAAVQFNSTVAKAECGATFGATAAAISSDMATHG